MTSSRLLWTLAVVLTLAFSVWQRVSGPTFPIYGRIELNGATFRYKLERTHAGPGDAIVELTPGGGAIGVLEWRDHEPAGPWHAMDLISLSSRPALAAPIPHHAPGQKVDYRVKLEAGDATTVLPPTGFATLRFRNDVPWWILIPHIVCMIGALLMSTRAALEAIARGPKLRPFTLRTISALFLGGFPLGLAVSGYAFGVPWGGFPLGNDATDNKTLIAFVAWLLAGAAVFRARDPRGWVLGAAVVMLAVYLVPHSLTLPR
jgi:hypothetical protein